MQIDTLYDCIVIGAGVSGASIAFELSKFKGEFAVLEAQSDVCMGTSKANSAIVHAGYDAEPGSLMALYNVRGNHMMAELCERMGVEFEHIGSLVVATDESEVPHLEELLERGEKNGVANLRIIQKDELMRLEPHLIDDAYAALYAPSAGIVNPFELTVAFAELAAQNGVNFYFNQRVSKIEPSSFGYLITCQDGTTYMTRAICNAAGVYADIIHNMLAAADNQLHIHARKGEYYLLDTHAKNLVHHTIFSLPGPMGKGVLVSPTTAQNIIVGPTSHDVDDKDDVSTSASGLKEVREKAARIVKNVPLRENVVTFSGLRAHQDSHDFVIGEIAGAPGAFDCAAIESPGLTSAPAIAQDLSQAIAYYLKAEARPHDELHLVRDAMPKLEAMDPREWGPLWQQDPAYGHMICRCRSVSEAQIVRAIHECMLINAEVSVDAIKRRTHATMGRCQGGFCTPPIMDLIARETHRALTSVSKFGEGSEYVVALNKQVR